MAKKVDGVGEVMIYLLGSQNKWDPEKVTLISNPQLNTAIEHQDRRISVAVTSRGLPPVTVGRCEHV